MSQKQDTTDSASAVSIPTTNTATTLAPIVESVVTSETKTAAPDASNTDGAAASDAAVDDTFVDVATLVAAANDE